MDNQLRKADYAKLFKAKYEQYNKGFTIQESFLRRELAITNNLQTYTFKFLQGDQTQGPTEYFLNKNDVFEMTSIGMYLTGRTTAQDGAEELQTYPNIQAFPAAAGFTPRHLYVFYNAYLSYSVGTTTFVQNLDTKRFFYVPQTQQSAATNYSQVDLENDGRIFLEPALTVSGANDNTFNIVVPTFAGIQVASVTAGLTNVLVLDLRGFLVKGAAQAITEAQ